MMQDGEEAAVADGFGLMFKKWFMRQFWRAQQSQVMISFGFWAATLTMLIFDRIEHRWDAGSNMYGVPISYWVMVSLFLSVFLFVLLVGWTYDNIFSLWRERSQVEAERNPWATYLLNATAIHTLGLLSSIQRQLNPDDEKITAECDFITDWIAYACDEELFVRHVNELERRVSKEMPELHYLPPGAVQKAREQNHILNDD